jgi:hypothetical protein
MLKKNENMKEYREWKQNNKLYMLAKDFKTQHTLQADL